MSTRLEVLKRYLFEDPSDSFLRYALALEFMSLNNFNDAFIELEKLVNDDPDYLAAYYMAGKNAELTDQSQKAKEFYLRGVEVARHQNNQHTLSELNAAIENLEE